MRIFPGQTLVIGWLLFLGAQFTHAAEGPAAGVVKLASVLTPAALAKLESEALGGFIDSQLELALAFDDGTAGKKDPVIAAKWYQRAADQHVGVAHLRLGMLSEAGGNFPQSYTKAREHYERAVALGVPEANLRLGILYLEGWGVARNPETAVALIEKAADANYRPAQNVLSEMYIGGIGVKRDSAKAVMWAERAAKTNDPESETRLGAIALGRKGLPQDIQLAREWFQLSASQEYSSGMLAMAATFLRPNRTEADAAFGMRWLELATDNGNAAAAFYLGAQLTLTAGSTLAPETEARVRQLLRQSAASGESAAGEVLELANDGKTLQEGFRHVLTVPLEDRYVQRYGTKRVPADPAKPGNLTPAIAKIVRPVFPRALRLTRTKGEVLVDFVVDPTGRVRNAVVVRGTHEAFSAPALAAVRQWIFLPGVKNGQLVYVHMQVPVHFYFSEVEEAGKPKAAHTPTVSPSAK